MSKTPTERYTKDVAGMPCYAATTALSIFISQENMAEAVAGDDEHCAIAEGCRRQLHTPYVSVGRSRTDLAMPHPKGVVKPGYGKTRWAVIRFQNPPSARSVIVDADLEQLPTDNGDVLVELMPPKPTERPEERRQKNADFRQSQGLTNPGAGVRTKAEDRLTLMGVRNLTGQRKRKGGT